LQSKKYVAAVVIGVVSDPLEPRLSFMCYHDEFGHSASNDTYG